MEKPKNFKETDPNPDRNSGGNQGPDQLPTISRRRFIRLGFGLGLVVLLGLSWPHREEIASEIGKTLDRLLEVENMSNPNVPIILPRETDQPIVTVTESEKEIKTIDLQMIFDKNSSTYRLVNHNQSSNWGLEFPQKEELKINLSGNLTEVGYAIITDIRGLQKGEQQYCVMFRTTDNQYIAVGYEGGLYFFEPINKEWVRIVDENKQVLRTKPKWEGLNLAPKPIRDQIYEGWQTFSELGYEPFGGILPNVQMPMNNNRVFSRNEFYTDDNTENVAYLLGQNGELLDLVHVQGTAEKLVLVANQIFQQYQQGKKTFEVTIPHYEGEMPFPYQYEVIINESITDEDIPLLAFLVIQAMSFQMEAVSQMLVKEIAPMFPRGGLTPEDKFSNTIGAWTMVQYILHEGLVDTLNSIKDNDHSARALQEVLDNVIQKMGYQKPSSDVDVKTLGINPYIPVLAKEIDAQNSQTVQIPRFFDLEKDENYIERLKNLRDKVQLKTLKIPGFDYNFVRMLR